MEASLKSKALYKTGLILLKMIPMLLALCCLCNLILSYFNLDVCVLSYIGGISVIPLVFLYLASHMFRFCEYHRIFLQATFDNYVREGKLPRGKHEIGFKELSWSKKELDEFVKKCRDSTFLHSKKHFLA